MPNLKRQELDVHSNFFFHNYWLSDSKKHCFYFSQANVHMDCSSRKQTSRPFGTEYYFVNKMTNKVFGKEIYFSLLFHMKFIMCVAATHV